MVVTTTTPEWLLGPPGASCRCTVPPGRRRGGFIARTLEGVTAPRHAELVAEAGTRTTGLLQGVDARMKVVALGVALMAVASVHHLRVLLLAHVAVLALAAVSGLPLRRFAGRVWLVVPLFTGVVALPVTVNLVTPGAIVVPLGHWFGHDLGLTAPGLSTAAVLLLRVATSAALVTLVTLTTPWPRLLAALRALAVPRVFVMILQMTYRYLFHLLEAVGEMYTARRSRTAGPVRPSAGRAMVAASAGALFGRTYGLATEVHQAMVARGYRGEPRPLERFRFRLADAAAPSLLACGAVVLIGLDRAL